MSFRAFWSSMSEDVTDAPTFTSRAVAAIMYPIGLAGWVVAAAIHPPDEYTRSRRRDIAWAIFLALFALFVFIGGFPGVYGAEPNEWVYDMVKHGHWDVGRVVATCDGRARVYIVRGDTGVALTVVPDGCAQ